LKQAEVACLVDRGQRLGRWALSGPGIQAVQALISIHAAQLQSDDCTHHLRTTVLREMRRRMQEGHTINAQPVGLRGSLT